MPTTPRSAVHDSLVHRHRRIIAGIAIGSAWCAAVIVVGIHLGTGERTASHVTLTTPTSSLPATTAAAPAPITPATVAPTDPIDPAGTDQAGPAATDPAQPEPPQPDPQPQVPTAGDGLVAPPTPIPTCDPTCVAPVDLHPLHPQRATPNAAGQLAGGDTAGCSLDCITRAQVFVTDNGNGGRSDARVEVDTHTPAFIEAFMHNSPPAVDEYGLPWFPGVQPVGHSVGDLDTSFSATGFALPGDAHYWVVVRATDDQGRRSAMTGEFATPFVEQDDDDVEVVFTGIDVWYDGDKGANKGELDFEWWIGDERIGGNGTYHRGNGSHIDLDGQVNSWAHFDLGGAVPPIRIFGIESDPNGGQFCTAGDPPFESGGSSDNCGLAWNLSVPYSPTLAEIAALPLCNAFPLDDRFDGYHCAIVGTHESGNGMPEFTVVMAFRLF